MNWRRQARAALETPPPGLRSATVNHANTGTHSLVPRIPPGSALVLAWDSAEAAAFARRLAGRCAARAAEAAALLPAPRPPRDAPA